MPLTWAETNMENNPALSAKDVKELQAKTVAAKDGQKAAFKKQRMDQFAKSKEEPKGPGRPPALRKPDHPKILPKTKGSKRVHSDEKDEKLDSEEELSTDESVLSDKDSETEPKRAMPAKKTTSVVPTKKPVCDSKTAEPAVKGKVRKEVKKDSTKKPAAAVMLGYLASKELANKEMKVSEKKAAEKNERSKSPPRSLGRRRPKSVRRKNQSKRWSRWKIRRSRKRPRRKKKNSMMRR